MTGDMTLTYTDSNGAKPHAGIGLIYGRICNAMESIRAVSKDRTNEFHKYKFRGIDDMLTMIHPVLAQHRLFMVPDIIGEPKVVERASTKGKAELHVVVTVEWKIYTDDGSFVSFKTLGEASDTGDKGCNKAMSASQKYAIIQAFAVPTEGDNDTENRSPEFAAKGSKQKPGNLAAVTRALAPAPREVEAPPAREPDFVDAAFDSSAPTGGIDAELAALENPHHAMNWMKKHAKDLGQADITKFNKRLAELKGGK